MPPPAAERQSIKLPDQGANNAGNNSAKFRRAVMAGLLTSPQGVLGAPSTAKPTLG